MNQKSVLLASFHTLGCKLNFAESSTVGKLLSERGIHTAAEGEQPDICVVNTCSVTETADKKGRRLIRHLHRLYPEAVIIVTGCYAQLKPAEVAALEGVAIVAGANDKLRIATFLDEWLKQRLPILAVSDLHKEAPFMPSCERGDRTRYFLKVQDGCDYFCTYCTIPYARGRSRSGSIAELTAMAREVAKAGGREIVLTGVNIGDFGRGSQETFFDLIRALDEVVGIDRYRISSIEPNLLTEEIIRWVAEESRAFMPHFHIPLQAGSDEVLRSMNRRYDTALFAERIALIKELMPEAFIGIDIMTGARGETPQLWEKSLAFAESLPVSRMHIFPYSERPGTAALRLGGPVSQEEKHRRSAQLAKVSERKMLAFMQANLQSERPVLWEQPHGRERMTGLTDNYLRVSAPLQPELINTITTARLADIPDPAQEIILGSLV